MGSHQNVIDYFSLLKRIGHIAPSYLLVGNDLLALARTVARTLSCEQTDGFCGACAACRALEKEVCGDIMIIDQSPAIKIEHIREAQSFLSLRSVVLPRKIVIVHNAHNLGDEAANAFLKTLEEPPGNSLLLLTTSRLDNIIPTIVSRCRKIYCTAPRQYEFHGLPLLEEFLSEGGIKLKERPRASELFSDLIVFLRDRIVFELTGDRKQLLEPRSCEIILTSGASCDTLLVQLERALEIYNNLDTINLNLAGNLMRTGLCRVTGRG